MSKGVLVVVIKTKDNLIDLGHLTNYFLINWNYRTVTRRYIVKEEVFCSNYRMLCGGKNWF